MSKPLIVFHVDLGKKRCDVEGATPEEISIVYLPARIPELTKVTRAKVVIRARGREIRADLGGMALNEEAVVRSYRALARIIYISSLAYFLRKAENDQWGLLPELRRAGTLKYQALDSKTQTKNENHRP